MNGMQLYAALVLCLLLNRVLAEYRNKVPYQNAIKRCQGSGGLAPSNYFNPVPGTVRYPPEHPDLGVKYDDVIRFSLKDGESAWVAGFASYSLPVVFKECVVWIKNTAREFNDNSIYSCLNYCGYNSSTTDSQTYIGVYSRYCVCLTYNDMSNATRIQCDTANESILGVYEVKTEMKQGEFLYQCNIKQLNTKTVKCTDEHNSICYTKNKLKCTSNEHTFVNYSESGYCIVAEPKTWLDSVNYCKTIEATILTRLELVKIVNETIGYWEGTFRSFTVAGDRTGNRPCLVVTRVNNKLVLEPDDCEKNKKYICKNNVTQNHGDNKNKTTTFGKTTSVIQDTFDGNVHNRTHNSIKTTTFGKTTSVVQDTFEDNVHNRTHNRIKTTTFGTTNSDISDKIIKNVYNRTGNLDGNNQVETNYLIIGIVIGVGSILALFGVILFFLSIRKICNKTHTPIITDFTKECHQLDPVDEEQTYDEIRGSYVQPRSEPLVGKQMSHSCDSMKGTIVGKADYDNDINPIRLHINQRDNLNTDLYSYSRIGHEHGSDGYDICSSASRFRKTGATSNNYDKMDLRDKHIRV